MVIKYGVIVPGVPSRDPRTGDDKVPRSFVSLSQKLSKLYMTRIGSTDLFTFVCKLPISDHMSFP